MDHTLEVKTAHVWKTDRDPDFQPSVRLYQLNKGRASLQIWGQTVQFDTMRPTGTVSASGAELTLKDLRVLRAMVDLAIADIERA